MMWVDQEFAERVFTSLPKYRKIPGAQFKLNARCPLCGDSRTDPNKARFWCYGGTNGSFRLKCYNCDYSDWFNNYLRDHEPELYREYLFEKKKDQIQYKPKSQNTSSDLLANKVAQQEKPKIARLQFCTRLDKLPETHPIINYVNHRKIPRGKWDRLWFTNDWPKLVNSVNPGTYKYEKNEPRLVIPIFNKQKEIESFQGRALLKNQPQKYMTIKSHPEATKIYGADTVNPSDIVFFMEGPLDSLFVKNGMAITGGSLSLSEVPYPNNRAWIMDHEPRKEDTIKRMEKLVRAGENVVFWDKAPWKSKDINDMIMKEGATVEQIDEYIRNNICSGLQAKLRLKHYAKV
ncbi:DNA primase / DNA helicase [Cronobacter phage vB_Cdu_VP8]|nr:DNA primase / DNA helicase [Cronobacter phage vB_Cdu_VP8]